MESPRHQRGCASYDDESVAVVGHSAELFGANNAFARAAQPVELAPLFVFLASEQDSYVTGEVYGATGGQMPV